MTTVPLSPPARSRSPWQWLYGQGHRLRERWYRTRAERLPRPVVSVGNLHWGGSGKTPITATVAAHLRDRGRRVAILSRGYGRRGEGTSVRIVSDGEGPLLGPRLAGDEPVLLAGLLPGVAVVVGADRHTAGLHALERLEKPPDLFVLDDGFSHLRLARDLDLLTFPASDPFAGARLAPGGRLREPLASARRAHAAILTASERDDDGDLLAKALRPYGFSGRGFRSETRAGEARWVTEGRPCPPGRALVVSAIARPRVLLETARRLGFEIAADLAFGDHHDYPAASLERIAAAFRESRAELVLTTGKDRVKLQGRLELPLAEIPIRAEPESDFFTWLDGRLAEIEAR